MTTSKRIRKQWAREQSEARDFHGELGRVLSAPEAIRRQCLQCKGYRIEQVRLCDARHCWLYRWRTGDVVCRCACHGAKSAGHCDEGSMPTGRYTAVLCESDMVQTRRNGGCLALAFRVVEGKHKGRVIRNKLFLAHGNLGRRNDAIEDLRSICLCTGVLKPRDSRELHGIPLVLHVERKQGRDGRIRSVIEGYERLVENASTEKRSG